MTPDFLRTWRTIVIINFQRIKRLNNLKYVLWQCLRDLIETIHLNAFKNSNRLWKESICRKVLVLLLMIVHWIQMDYLKYSSTEDYDKKFNSVHTAKNEVNENISFICKSNHIKRVRNRTASDTDVAISESNFYCQY